MGNKSSKTSEGGSPSKKGSKSTVVSSKGAASAPNLAAQAPVTGELNTAKKVLLAVDHSNYSLDACNWLVENFLHKGDELTIITVFQAFEPAPRVPLVNDKLTDEQIAKIKEDADAKSQKTGETLLETLAANLENKGFKPRTLVMKTGDSPKEALVKLTEKEAFTVACVASRGHGALKRTILGSTGDYLMHHANCPVFVIKTE